MSKEAIHVASGKVRELFQLDEERLLLVASDRISTFDEVHPTEVPDKGRVLTGLSAFWFARTQHIVPNHLLTVREDGRSTECLQLQMFPVECVVRGYITGSAWEDYLATGATSGHTLRAGLEEAEKLPTPIFTPATKATTGHDENIDRDQAAALIGEEQLAQLERYSLELYQFGADHAAKRGIILADTKFEFGIGQDGQITLGDEALTPDSSRFWPAAEYQKGGAQSSFDKQFVRDYVKSIGWDKNPPAPELPDTVITGTRTRYIEAFELLTGISFEKYTANPEIVRT